jgi:hypothetical protein
MVLNRSFRDEAPDVAECALYALSTIAFSVEGAIAVIEAEILQISDELLRSATVGVRQWTSAILEQLASHASTAGAVIEMNPCRRLVELLRQGFSIPGFVIALIVLDAGTQKRM